MTSKIQPLLYVVSMLIAIVLLQVHCIRDNPFDINSVNYIPGKKPHVNFIDSLITGYLLDSIRIKIAWSDTARGGERGLIKKILIDWNGTGSFSQSVNGNESSPFVLNKVFNPQKNIIRVKGIDNENDTSGIDSAWLDIKRSSPQIISIDAPSVVEKGSPFSIRIKATDTGGVIASYYWAVDESTFSRVTDSAYLKLSFDKPGKKTILVKVRDNKKIESPQQSITINVSDPNDTVGPNIAFLSPLKNDTVRTRDCTVSLQVSDVSGVTKVAINSNSMQQVEQIWRGNVILTKGENVLTVVAVDSKGFKTTSAVKVFYIPPKIDQTSPALVLLAPVSWTDTINTGTMVVKLLANDESGVAGVYLNAEQMKFDGSDSSYSTEKKLQEGINRFFIKSVDILGNSGTDTLSVFLKKDAVDTIPPVISVITPLHQQRIYDTVVTVRGTVTDASRISSVNVNGIAASLKYPSWSVSYKLKHGFDTLVVTAVDSSVNRRSAQKSLVVIQNRKPNFISQPVDTVFLINSDNIFSASVVDDDSKLDFSLGRTKNTYGTVSALTSTASKTSFTYKAVKAGIDTFTLIVKDPWSDADTAWWRVFVVAPTDSTPIFITDPKTLPASLSAMDTCRLVVTASDPQGKKLIYSLLKPVPNGMTIDSLSGKIVWIPQESDTGNKTITVQVNNGKKTSTLVWNTRIVPRNYPPVFSASESQVINELQKITLLLKATDQNNDPLEFTFGSTIPAGARLDGNQFTWTPGLADADSYKITFIVRELNRLPSLSDTQTVSIIVKNVNQKPVLTSPGTLTCVAGRMMTYTLQCFDPDSDKLTFSMQNAPKGAVLTGDKFSWTPSSSDAGTHYLKFIASDNSLMDTISVTIRVNSVNSAPVLTNPGDKTISENQLLQFTLAATDPNSDSLIYSMHNAPSGATLNGKIFSWKPSYTQSGTYTIIFSVRDNVLPPLSDSVTVTVTVVNVNASPVLTSPGNKTVTENSSLTFSLSATDIDKDIISYSMSSAPQGTKLSGNFFSWTPSYTQAGIYNLTFYASDNRVPPLLDSQMVTIEVKNLNRPPVFTDSSSKSVNENEAFQFQLLAYDPDGAEVRYSAKNLPSGATLDMWGIFRWKPTWSQAGTYPVTFFVHDSSSLPVILRDTATIKIIVNNVNRPPVFTDSASYTIAETSLLSFQLKASDPDGNTVSFLSNNLPAGATLNAAGQFSWTPKIDQANVYNVRFIARDNSVPSKVLDDTVTIRITVTNTSPSIPVLLTPVDKAVFQPRTMTFTWNSATNSTGYFLQVAKDTGFTNVVVLDSGITATQKSISGLVNNTTYYWRIRALNPGSRSIWSTRRSFTTLKSFPLVINATNGTVVPTPSGSTFDSATVVSLKATASTGYEFSNWSGDITGTVNPASVKMSAAKTVTANFRLK